MGRKESNQTIKKTVVYSKVGVFGTTTHSYDITYHENQHITEPHTFDNERITSQCKMRCFHDETIPFYLTLNDSIVSQ